MATTLYEPAFAVTAAWFSRHRARAVLVLTIAGGLSSTVFVPLAGVLVGAYGWRTTLILLAGTLCVLTVPLNAGVLRRWPSDRGVHPDGQPPADTPSADSAMRSRPDTVRAVTRSASFRWLATSMFAHTTAKLAVTVILVAYLTDRGYSLPQATLAAGAVGAFQVLGRLVCSALRPWLPEHRTTILLFAASALALPAPLLTTGAGPAATAAIVALVICFGLGYGLPDLLRGTLVVDYYGSPHYPRINGTLATFVVAARATGPLLAGLALTTLHTQTPTLAGASALTAISACALHRAHRAQSAGTARG
jgi:predicted MFS family arabinose efflux permease